MNNTDNKENILNEFIRVINHATSKNGVNGIWVFRIVSYEYPLDNLKLTNTIANKAPI